MMSDPRHGEGQAVFVAALGDEIEEVIRADQNIQSPRIAGIGMKDFARRILGEDAGTRTFFAGELAHGVVVVDLAAGPLLRREGNVIVEIEIAAEGRDPLKLPAHAPSSVGSCTNFQYDQVFDARSRSGLLGV